MMAEARRLQVLAAMGIEVLRLRTSPAGSATTGSMRGLTADPVRPDAAATRVLIVCARGDRDDARTKRIATQLPHVLGTNAASIGWCEADARGEIGAQPAVSAYLVLGDRMARALGAQLPTVQQNSCVIAVIGEPDSLPADGAGKRVLWHALKPIARAMRGNG